jgi:hypothetical protein
VKHESEKEEPSTSVLQPLSESATSTSAQPVLLIAEMRAQGHSAYLGSATKII